MIRDDKAKLPELTYNIVPIQLCHVDLLLNFQECIRLLEFISDNVERCLNRRVFPVVSSEIF